jgi:two-component system, OmpR family, sensor histidine kinase VicK
MEPFLRDLVELADGLARERGNRLRAAVSGEGRLRIDQERIEQAVLIVVDNAAKFNPADGEIILTATTKSGELCIEVEDQGPGIREEEFTRIFERFYRANKAGAQKQSGTGLGLSIAKAITEMHGGRIEAANRATGGTRMSVCLPLIKPPQRTGLPLRR